MKAGEGMLGVIPARKGSKGVKGKNIRLLNGRPLIAHTIEVAMKAKLERLIVSTDSEEIADIARKFGAEVPFLRPDDLATDEAPMVPTLLHAMEWFDQCVRPCRAVVLFQPTSPFRDVETIEKALLTFEKENCDVLMSLNEAQKHPLWMKVIRNNQVEPFLPNIMPPSRRQELNPVYTLNGCIFIWRREALLKRRDLNAGGPLQLEDEKIGHVLLEQKEAFEIDSEIDFLTAEIIAKQGVR
jgi:CMP-N,N'-diacetyllegionaminic acid synthase